MTKFILVVDSYNDNPNEKVLIAHLLFPIRFPNIDPIDPKLFIPPKVKVKPVHAFPVADCPLAPDTA